MRTLNRRPIPVLGHRGIKIGAAELSHRSFPTGKKSFLRHYKGETLELEVEFKTELESPLVILSSDINNPWGAWQDLRFERVGENRFVVKVLLERCGVFRFKVKYSANESNNFFWLKGAYSYLLVEPPSAKVVRMYTLLPNVSGKISDWREYLQHIKSMNFDMLHCLPITSLDDSESPYSAYDLFDVDSYYLNPTEPGTALDQLEEFIETAKALGIRLCFDLVINHIGISSLLAQTRPDWLQHDENEPDGLKRAGCWHHQDWIRWGDLALINYDHPVRSVRKEIRNYMKQYILFWAHYANYTRGMIRYDNLHSSHSGFIHEITILLQAQFPNLLVLAEFFTSEEEFIKQVPDWSLNLLQANPWECLFVPELRGYIKQVHARSEQLRYLFSITTHDTPTPTERFGGALSTIPRYFVCALFSTGQTGLVQGVEYGHPEKINFIGRQAKLEFGTEYDFRHAIKIINQLIDEYPVFQRGGNLRFIDKEHGAILGAYRYSNCRNETEFLLFANLDISGEHDVWFDLASNGIEFESLENVFTEEPPIEYTGSHLPLHFMPGEVKAFKIRPKTTAAA